MSKKLISIVLSLSLALTAFAQNIEEREPADTLRPIQIEIKDTVTTAFLDSLVIDDALELNDYSMIGVNYGIGRAQTMFNPVKTQGNLNIPSYYGITYTKYGKFFGYMPYFGLQIGLFKGTDGYVFKPNDEGEYNVTVDGATKVVYDFIEVPLVAQFHIDSHNFKILADGGMYLGYRYKIHREGNFIFPDLMDDFTDYEYKWDYGFKVGLGAGLVFSPIEVHVKLNMRYGLGDIYRPDYASSEYYRFATPLDLILTIGVHYQLSRRSGKTKSQIKEQARRIVYGEEN
ncbi:MAG: outer membrane beta-barrel protein [Bacteroidales bacterium]|nr:outer membrane beta-barrel protein [Bacteroidales bacterium]